MAEKPYTYTVDVEYDWGGRTTNSLGIAYGVPKFLELFKQANVKALFFISTEILLNHKKILSLITKDGHEIGSHGHFHVVYKSEDRARADKELSMTALTVHTGKRPEYYRAPKFSYKTEDIYSDPKNHVGLLKHMWFDGPIPKDPIFYMHPFDIIKDKWAPNLFCKVWYSRPAKALQTLKSLLQLYPGEHRLR